MEAVSRLYVVIFTQDADNARYGIHHVPGNSSGEKHQHAAKWVLESLPWSADTSIRTSGSNHGASCQVWAWTWKHYNHKYHHFFFYKEIKRKEGKEWLRNDAQQMAASFPCI